MHEARWHKISSGFIFIFDEPVVVLFRLSERTVNTLQYVGSKGEGVIFLYRWLWKGSFGLWKDTPNIAARFPAVICQSYFFKCDRFISLLPSPPPNPQVCNSQNIFLAGCCWHIGSSKRWGFKLKIQQLKWKAETHSQGHFRFRIILQIAPWIK